jgi:hypothetical protein
MGAGSGTEVALERADLARVDIAVGMWNELMARTGSFYTLKTLHTHDDLPDLDATR